MGIGGEAADNYQNHQSRYAGRQSAHTLCWRRVPGCSARYWTVQRKHQRSTDQDHGRRFRLEKNNQVMSATVSSGTSTFPCKDIADIQQSITIADEAMYSTKISGRDWVVSLEYSAACRETALRFAIQGPELYNGRVMVLTALVMDALSRSQSAIGI